MLDLKKRTGGKRKPGKALKSGGLIEAKPAKAPQKPKPPEKPLKKPQSARSSGDLTETKGSDKPLKDRPAGGMIARFVRGDNLPDAVRLEHACRFIRWSLAGIKSAPEAVKVHTEFEALRAIAATHKLKCLERKFVEGKALIVFQLLSFFQPTPPKERGRGHKKNVARGATLFSRFKMSKKRRIYPKTSEDMAAALKEAARREVSPTDKFLEEWTGKQRIEAAKVRKADKEARKRLKSVKLYNLPIADLAAKIAPESVDVIFTDPPYNKPGIPTYSELSRFAGKCLRKGGSLIALSGNLYLPEILARVIEDKRIRWNFQLAYVMDGPTPQIHAAKAFSSVKPVLWLVKPPYRGEYINNRITAPPRQTSSNEYHKWGQSVEGMGEILRHFAFPGDTVCDPFVGGGSIALAAHKRGCKFIGGDIDPEAVKITRGRLAKEAGKAKDK